MIKINVSNVDDFSFTFTILNGGAPGGMALYIVAWFLKKLNVQLQTSVT